MPDTHRQENESSADPSPNIAAPLAETTPELNSTGEVSMSQNITAAAVPATRYAHAIMSKNDYQEMLVGFTLGGESGFLKMTSDFYGVEYLNSPLGIQVYAYHGMNNCEAFYPASIDFQKVTGFINHDEVGSIGESEVEGNHVWHSTSRKMPGFLINATFGRMVQGGDSEAPTLDLKEFQKLEVHDTPAGLVVAALKGRKAHVIFPCDQVERLAA